MATNSINEKTEKPLIHYLYYGGYCNPIDEDILSRAFHRGDFGIISAPMLLERCIAYVSNHLEHTSEHHLDFDDQSDAKYGTVSSYTFRDPKCTIWCKGKLGGIRAMVYEPKTSIMYFFCVPRDKYKSTIDVEFHADGTPKRLSSKTNKINKIWLCEVIDFAAMANFKF